MNWAQLRAMVWLRWRLTRHQLARGGQVNAVVSAIFVLLTLVFESGAGWHFSAAALGSVLYLGTVAAGLGFVLIVWLTINYSASRVNVFVFLSPVFGVLIGWALLGEPISLQQALGGLAVALGILTVSTEA